MSHLQEVGSNDSVEGQVEMGGLARLLRLLAAEGAYGVACARDGGFVCVMTPRNGVSVQIARFALDTIEAARSRGLVFWEQTMNTTRLFLTAEGLASADDPAVGDIFAPSRPKLARGLSDQGPAAIDEAESPLAWLARRKLIGPAAFAAGERLRADFTLAASLPRVTTDWAGLARGPSGPSMTHVTDRMLAARQRVDRAMTAVGPDFADLLIDVCGFLKGLELVETERRWPRRSAKIILAMALDRLAAHYGLSDGAKGRERAPIRHWGGMGYRPAAGPVPAGA